VEPWVLTEGSGDWEQEAERRDRAADQRDQDAAAHDDLADERDRFSRRRDELASIRDQAAHQREKAALQRDWEATARDHAAVRRDPADRRARPTDASQVGAYEQAAIDGNWMRRTGRRRPRTEQRRPRTGGGGRGSGPVQAGSGGGAQGLVGAAGNREQAAVERALHARDTAPDWVLGQAHRRVQAVRGRAQQTARTAAGIVERFIKVKQRELAVRLASIQVHEQLASLPGCASRSGRPRPVPRRSGRGSSTGLRVGNCGVSGAD
jgi:hypothetical protein